MLFRPTLIILLFAAEAIGLAVPVLEPANRAEALNERLERLEAMVASLHEA